MDTDADADTASGDAAAAIEPDLWDLLAGIAEEGDDDGEAAGPAAAAAAGRAPDQQAVPPPQVAPPPAAPRAAELLPSELDRLAAAAPMLVRTMDAWRRRPLAASPLESLQALARDIRAAQPELGEAPNHFAQMSEAEVMAALHPLRRIAERLEGLPPGATILFTVGQTAKADQHGAAVDFDTPPGPYDYSQINKQLEDAFLSSVTRRRIASIVINLVPYAKQVPCPGAPAAWPKSES